MISEDQIMSTEYRSLLPPRLLNDVIEFQKEGPLLNEYCRSCISQLPRQEDEVARFRVEIVLTP